MKNFYSTKWWKLMKICTAQLMIAAFFCSVAIAHNNYGQELLNQPITISLTDVSLEVVLNEVAQVSGARFAYSLEALNLQQKITLKADNKLLGDVLAGLLSPLGIKYFLNKDGTTISLKKEDIRKSERDQQMENVDLLSEYSHRILISGSVVDQKGQPIAGASVMIKGSLDGTNTDANGKFTINAEENDILVFSFIGFTAYEVKIGTQTQVDVILQEDVKNLGEVIINVGYWEVKEKEKTGNTARVTSEEIQKQNITNPLQSLQGRMTGVYVQQSTGMPGGGIKIQIRGQNSLRTGADGGVNGNLPLYVVDGVPFTNTSLTSPSISGGSIAGGNPLSTINPNDIESIEVLKDADATAIYGSRGANGVVLITTRQAKAGKTKLDVNLSQGIGQVSQFMKLLGTPQYLTMRREGFKNDGEVPANYNAPDLLLWDTTRYTDWQKKLIGGTGKITNGNLSFSGGTDRTQFLVSAGYYRETSVFPGTNSYQRGTGRLFVHHQSIDRKFKIEASTNYSISSNDLPSTDFTGLAITLAPVAPKLFLGNGELNWENGTWTNPLASQKKKYLSTINTFVANSSLSYELLTGLTLKSNFGYTSMVVDEVSTNPISSRNPIYAALLKGSSNFGDGNIRTWIIEPQMDFNRKIAEGQFSVTAGGTWQQSVQKNKTVQAYGYSTDALLENLSAASSIFVADNNYSLYKYAAAFARINYNWKAKYIVNLTGRRDGSSRFGPGNRFGNFGAVGAAWIFSNENFISDHLPFLTFGKLRTSYGTTGSDAIGDYQYLETFSPTSYPYGGVAGLQLTRLANPGYSWETNKKFEAGIELGILNDRVTLSSSFYLNRSSSQLVGLPLPVITGQSSVQFNLPAIVRNQGWEFQAGATWVKKQYFEWSSNVNVTLPQNKLVQFPDLENFPSYASRYEIGKSIYTYKGFQSNGVDPKTGIYSINDRNKDGELSSADYVGLKKSTQTMYGGLANKLKYRDFQLDFFFQFVKQTGIGYQTSFDVPGMLSNQPTVVMNRWQNENDKTSIQRFAAVDPTSEVLIGYYYNIASDAIIQDASFIRLKNVSLAWQLPATWTTGIVKTGSNVFVQAQNLLTITNYIGLDPETQSTASLPPLRVITAGIRLSL